MITGYYQNNQLFQNQWLFWQCCVGTQFPYIGFRLQVTCMANTCQLINSLWGTRNQLMKNVSLNWSSSGWTWYSSVPLTGRQTHLLEVKIQKINFFSTWKPKFKPKFRLRNFEYSHSSCNFLPNFCLSLFKRGAVMSDVVSPEVPLVLHLFLANLTLKLFPNRVHV